MVIWDQIAAEVAREFPHVTWDKMLVDAMTRHSSMPSRDMFAYTFDKPAKVIDEFTEKVGLSKYALYVQDYGAPVGYRLAAKHPERVQPLWFRTGTRTTRG